MNKPLRNDKDLAELIGLETPQAQRALSWAVYNLMVFDKKQKDYGPKNISGNPCPELAVAIRSNDKVQRLMNLLYNNKQASNESIFDSWSDLANYGLIGMLLNTGEWDSPEEATTLPELGIEYQEIH